MNELTELLERRPVLARAREYAVLAHGTQMYGPRPYSHHLDQVVRNLVRFGHLRGNLLCAGFLHDVVEDTAVTVRDVQGAFGHRVAALVFAVTDGPGPNRAGRKERPYMLIPGVPGALLVKLADRLANVEWAVRDGQDRLLRMYRHEHPGFEGKLRGPPEAEPMFKAVSVALREDR